MAPLVSARLLLPLLLTLFLWEPTPASARWQTLNGQAPVVVANGGLSGLFPDQTSDAYYYALYNSLPGVALSCDLQLSPQPSVPQLANLGVGICRTNLQLSNSTGIKQVAPQLNTTHLINGVNVTDFFAIDIPYVNLTQLAFATQSVLTRTPVFDNQFQILGPVDVTNIIKAGGTVENTLWLNSEYTQFIEANSNLNATLYLLEAIQELSPGYVSVPEISLLKAIQATPNTSQTKAFYKFLDTATADASTNQTYDALKQNLTYIKSLASGILVPKSFIWNVDPSTLYLSPPSTLVEDAHKAGLEVFVYDLANDNYPTSNNFTYDPITEVLTYIENSYNFSVDGLFTDFPATASEAISCYAANSRNTSLQSKEALIKKPKVISHNGNSGKFPAATSSAYYSAIDAGVDYIDCIVQISKDSVPFCRPTPNLIESTDVSTNSNISQQYLRTYPGFYDGKKGIFTFDLTSDLISSLRATMYSPVDGIMRDQNYNGQFGIITLADFLSIAKNNSKGALIGIENAVYIRDIHNIAIVDAVVNVLSTAGYNSTDNVIIQSEDSSALARFRALNVTYPLMYEVIYSDDSPVRLDATDLAEIKQYASMVNFNARLVEPWDSAYFLMTPSADVIALAHAQNLTTYFEVQKNEFGAIAFDFQADPTIELFSLMNDGIDGIITDFPITVKNYLDNQCLGDGLTSSTVNYSIPLIVRGVLGKDTGELSPASAPLAPVLVVPEPSLAGLPLTPGPAPPETEPASASHISTSVLAAAFGLVLYLLVVV